MSVPRHNHADRCQLSDVARRALARRPSAGKARQGALTALLSVRWGAYRVLGDREGANGWGSTAVGRPRPRRGPFLFVAVSR